MMLPIPISFEVFSKEEFKRMKNRDYQKKYRHNNPEKVRKYDRKRYAENSLRKNSVIKNAVNWNKNNKEKIKAYMVIYRRNNPEKFPDNFKTLYLRKDFLEDKDLICNHCKKEFLYEEVEVDHIKCRKLFPELIYEHFNLQILCKPCHRIKTNKDLVLIKRIKQE